MENRVTVSICGEEYTFVAEEAPSYMQKVGAYIDDAAKAKNEVSELKRELFKLQNKK